MQDQSGDAVPQFQQRLEKAQQQLQKDLRSVPITENVREFAHAIERYLLDAQQVYVDMANQWEDLNSDLHHEALVRASVVAANLLMFQDYRQRRDESEQHAQSHHYSI